MDYTLFPIFPLRAGFPIMAALSVLSPSKATY